MEEPMYDFGMIGLGVMGSNLLQNMAGHDYKVTGYDRDKQKTAVLSSLSTENVVIKGVDTLAEMVASLKKPRKMMMLVPAGNPVDAVIEELIPLLDEGDIVIDGGNSYFADTLRRVLYMKGKGFHFMGMGISGGELGARTGPSIMPGGDLEAYEHVKPMLEAVAAKVNGEPCTAYMGKDAAGHYVKMVHNGIEYAIMQLISESYDLLKRGLGYSNSDLHDLFSKWNTGKLKSFLVEITAKIFAQKDEETGKELLDLISDKAGSKGTGKWTSQEAMNLPVPIPIIDMAVSMRDMSTRKEERQKAATIYQPEIKQIKEKQEFVHNLEDALYAAMLLSYAQGLAMLNVASKVLQMAIPLKDVVKVWRGGCIIRSSLLMDFYSAFQENNDLENLLLDKDIAKLFKPLVPALRKVVVTAVDSNISASAFMAALCYYESYTTERMPTNLIQAQRDFFGAHTYQRIDKEGIFHTEWQPITSQKDLDKASV